MGQSLLFGLQTLLFLKVALLLCGQVCLSLSLCFLSRFEGSLLVFVSFEQTCLLVDLGLGRTRIGCGSFGCRCRARWKVRSFFWQLEEVRRVVVEFGNVDEGCEELEVGAFVVELAEVVVLRVVSFAQWLESITGIGASVHGAEHRGKELVDTVALLDKGAQEPRCGIVVGGASEVGKDELLKLLNLILEIHEIHDGLVSSSGLSMFLSEMYSSYSKRPLNSCGDGGSEAWRG